jgi:xylan 1,4-beta-xylosidase
MRHAYVCVKGRANPGPIRKRQRMRYNRSVRTRLILRCHLRIGFMSHRATCSVYEAKEVEVKSFGFTAGSSLCAVVLASPSLSAQPAGRTYANPIDLDYKYNFEELNRGISYRSGADPVIVNHKGEYFLFSTVSGGYWHSRDLAQWTFIEPSRWPFEDIVAPAALSVRDTLYLLQSMTLPRPILFSTAPETGQLEFYNRLLPPPPGSQSPWEQTPSTPGGVPPGPWDPDIFHDPDTDKWYMYWGSSNFYPLFGIELDKQRRLLYADTPVSLLRLHPERHGWERFGLDHREARTPFLEGAWMTKHDGKYYLQYAAPGTEYNVYANGTYVGEHPLGPFTYAPYNPISYKPGGFMTGVGHGNTFRDRYGNYWNTGTAWIGINYNFERRLVMFPAGFDADGQMFVSTRFGDFPHRIPTSKWQNADELFTGWMLLSYRRPVAASSARDTFPASNATDENPRTFWVAGSNRPGEWLTIDLQRERDVKAVQVNFADYQSNIFVSDSTVYTQFILQHSRDGAGWASIADSTEERRDRPNAYFELPQPVRTRYIRYQHVHVASPNLAISDIRVFGNDGGQPPRTPAGLAVRRDTDPRNAFLTWRAVPGAVGYNIRWGIHPQKLYQTYQVFADQGEALEIRALTAGQEYHFAIEAFDEVGVSRLSDPVRMR